jgi:phosphonate transport system substrate-binding protein
LLGLPAVAEQIDVSRLRYLAVSPPLAHLPWAVASDMPDELAHRIQNLMLDLNDSQSGRNILRQMKLTGLHPAADTDYDQHREIIRTVLGENY